MNHDIPGFLQGLESGWVAFVDAMAVIVTIVGFLLPFLLVALPLLVALRWWLRRRRRSRPAAPSPSAAQPEA